jgi:hypothetical protein
MVVNQSGKLLATGTGDDPIKALASVATALLPGHPGWSWLRTQCAMFPHALFCALPDRAWCPPTASSCR